MAEWPNGRMAEWPSPGRSARNLASWFGGDPTWSLHDPSKMCPPIILGTDPIFEGSWRLQVRRFPLPNFCFVLLLFFRGVDEIYNHSRHSKELTYYLPAFDLGYWFGGRGNHLGLYCFGNGKPQNSRAGGALLVSVALWPKALWLAKAFPARRDKTTQHTKGYFDLNWPRAVLKHTKQPTRQTYVGDPAGTGHCETLPVGESNLGD